jgi:hypothetical protein
VVELGAFVDPAPHQSAAVHRDDDAVVALVAVVTHDGVPATSARRPIDVARIVTGHIVTQGIELHPVAPPH